MFGTEVAFQSSWLDRRSQWACHLWLARPDGPQRRQRRLRAWL